MARKCPRQIRKIRSVGSILVGGWIRGTRTSFNEKFSVFVASRRRQPTKIIARSMVSPVSCKVHATRNRAAVSESSFPPPFPMHRLFANLLLSPAPHRRRFSPTGPWIIHRIDRPPILLAPLLRLTILRDSWASLIQASWSSRGRRKIKNSLNIDISESFRRKKFLSKISCKLSNIETENFGSSWKKIPNSINNISILFFELFSADERRINDENSSERKIFSFEIFQR